MGAYDILTGTQLCMAVAMIAAYGFYFKRNERAAWYFSCPAWLIAIWSAVVLYYYSEYPFNDPLLPHGIFLRHGNRIVG